MKFASVVAATSCLTGFLAAPTLALAQSVPTAIFTDPPADAAHPAKMTVGREAPSRSPVGPRGTW